MQWLAIAVAIVFCWGSAVLAENSEPVMATQSKYDIALKSAFNRPDFYPIADVDSAHYRPVADWIGRLILPTMAEAAADPIDWVWIEILQAPNPHWQGQRVRLEWQDNPALQDYVQTVTRSVNFTDEAYASARNGNVHPLRLDGWQQVGPLQSLAGAHPMDDVVVALQQVDRITTATGETILRISTDPRQITGRYMGLVRLLEPIPDDRWTPADCPTGPPCTSELFRVQHYDTTAGTWENATDTLRIPQVLPFHDRLFQSTPHNLERSPAGEAGWYVYGAPDAEGLFTVQAIAPRRVFQLNPNNTDLITVPDRPQNYINFRNWRNTSGRKGTIQTAALGNGINDWQEGDRALVIHLFGGIGGQKAESLALPGTVTGHFSYGIATVIRDPFTQDLQFEIEYWQVYGHNPNGIISGAIAWANYTGGLQQGWLGTRPISDIVLKLDAVTEDYDFGTVQLSVMDELRQQLHIMMARYRIGDGTGASIVTPAQSCIQDSSQSVYRTIQAIARRVAESPEIQQWLSDQPNDPQTSRFQRLVDLGDRLTNELVPVGIVRADWRNNADVAGVRSTFETQNNLIAQLLSWRTVMPRVAYDQIANIFLAQGATAWVLKTNQVGGWDSTILPLAPTELFGQYVVIPTAFSRFFESLAVPTVQDWSVTFGALLAYGAIALVIARQQNFLAPTFSRHRLSLSQQIQLAIAAWVAPALLEELIFRVLLLPHPSETVRSFTIIIWLSISLGAFVIYHPLNALTFYKIGYPTFLQPVFLVLSGLLGLTCSGVYLLTGSLWTVAFLHWVVVVVWLLRFGGYERLNRGLRSPSAAKFPPLR